MYLSWEVWLAKFNSNWRLHLINILASLVVEFTTKQHANRAINEALVLGAYQHDCELYARECKLSNASNAKNMDTSELSAAPTRHVATVQGQLRQDEETCSA
jgi:hypothetical protein